jgi:hypothetical protein
VCIFPGLSLSLGPSSKDGVSLLRRAASLVCVCQAAGLHVGCKLRQGGIVLVCGLGLQCNTCNKEHTDKLRAHKYNRQQHFTAQDAAGRCKHSHNQCKRCCRGAQLD